MMEMLSKVYYIHSERLYNYALEAQHTLICAQPLIYRLNSL